GRICRGLLENRIAKTDERFSSTGSVRKSTQRTKAGHRRQHGDRAALDQPSRVAQPLSSFWLLGDKHLKRQAGESPRPSRLRAGVSCGGVLSRVRHVFTWGLVSTESGRSQAEGRAIHNPVPETRIR